MRRSSPFCKIGTLLQGVTVFRGGVRLRHKRARSTPEEFLRLNVDLPLVIEFFDEPKVAEAAIGLLGDLVPKAHIVSWLAARSGRRRRS